MYVGHITSEMTDVLCYFSHLRVAYGYSRHIKNTGRRKYIAIHTKLLIKDVHIDNYLLEIHLIQKEPSYKLISGALGFPQASQREAAQTVRNADEVSHQQ